MSDTLPSVARSPRRRPGGPRRWTASDKAAYLAAFATSRQSIKAFCAETGVPRATFTLWQREARAMRASPDASAFARVELVPPASGGITLAVRGRAGLAAKLTGLDATTVALVLRIVLRPGAR